jgi:hypothetical protein
MCDAPLFSTNLSGHINRFVLTCSQEAARALASSADGCIPLLIPGLPVVHCTLSAAFVGPKRLHISSGGQMGHSMSISGRREQKSRCRPRRCPMPQPILCLDEEVYHFAKRFDALSHTTASATGSPTVAPQSLNRGKNRDKSLLRIILVVLLSSMIIGLAVFLFTRSGTVCPTLTGVSSNTLKSYYNGTYTNTKYGGS